MTWSCIGTRALWVLSALFVFSATWRDGTGGPAAVLATEPRPGSPIHIRLAHIALEPDPARGQLQVAEVWILRNSSEETWRADGDGGALRLELPAGAFDLQSAMGAEWRLVDDGLLVTGPLPPGEHEFAITYRAPYVGSQFTVRHVLDWPTSELRLMVAWPKATIASPVLTRTQEVTMGNLPLTVASGEGLASGTLITATIGGLPPAASSRNWPAMGWPSPSQAELTGLALGLGLAACLLALLYGWRYRPRNGGSREPNRQPKGLGSEAARGARGLALPTGSEEGCSPMSSDSAQPEG